MGFSLGKVFSPVGSLLNGITGVTDTANESYKASKKLMSMENANNIALWNMQNEYNTPTAQIARMKEAGIDVNPMTYAVGNGNMSTTASSVSTATPHMPVYSGAGNPITTLMSVLSGIQDIEYKHQQNRILKLEADAYENTGIKPGSGVVGQLVRLAVNNPHVRKFVDWLTSNDGSDRGDKPSVSVPDTVIDVPHIFRVRKTK